MCYIIIALSNMLSIIIIILTYAVWELHVGVAVSKKPTDIHEGVGRGSVWKGFAYESTGTFIVLS